MAYRLNTAGTRNHGARVAAMAAALRSSGAGNLARFAAFVERSSFSTNVAADKILAFDAHGEVLDKRRALGHPAREEIGGGLRPPRSSGWFRRREVFESHWQHGRRLIYGAVNGGNMGTEGQYGPYCVVVGDPSALGCAALAVFPADTAASYTDPAGRLLVDEMVGAATTWDDRSALAVRERGSEARLAPETSWAAVLCRPDHYLETVLTPLQLMSVDEVRVRTAYRDDVETLELRFEAGEPLASIDRNAVAAYKAIREWEHRYGIAMRAY